MSVAPTRAVSATTLFVMSSDLPNYSEKWSSANKHREKLCKFYLSPQGCKKGINCQFKHPGENQNGSVNIEESQQSSCFASKAEEEVSFCKQFFKSGRCRFGDSCRFSHPLPGAETKDEDKEVRDADTNHPGERLCNAYRDTGRCRYGRRCKYIHRKEVSESPSLDRANTESHHAKKEVPEKGKGRIGRKRLCRYFKAGGCALGADCKFWHPGDLPEVDKDDSELEAPASATSVPQDTEPRQEKENVKPQKAAYRPVTQTGNYDAQALTDEAAKLLSESEIRLLKKRYPNAKQLSENVFAVVFSSSDPDWSYDVKEINLEITFPASYPKEVMKVRVAPDERTPDILRRYVAAGVDAWIKKRFEQLMKKGRVELIFRPFLRWLDKNLEDLFTEGLKAYQKELMAEAAGVQFIPAKQIQEQFAQQSSADEEETSSHHGNESDAPSPSGDDDNDVDNNDDRRDSKAPVHDTNQPQSMTKVMDLDPTKKGTELKLHNVQLRDGVASLMATKISLVIQCARCKNKTEISTPAGRTNAVTCVKCRTTQLVTFRPALLHQFSSVMGYLDMDECSAFDLILSESDFDVGCIECSKQMNMQGLPPGQPKETWCHHCHQKLSVAADTVRFLYLQPSSHLDDNKAVKVEVAKVNRVVKDPAIKLGQPLPEKGTCRHYKKSFRWLRFPCCGKAYPCDICHDEDNMDHNMKYANRMICGFCCKEQSYASSRACSGCNNFMTKKSSSHWEGGKGCRDKVTMSRYDAKKYQNTCKTMSRAAQALKDSKKKRTKSD